MDDGNGIVIIIIISIIAIIIWAIILKAIIKGATFNILRLLILIAKKQGASEDEIFRATKSTEQIYERDQQQIHEKDQEHEAKEHA